MKKCPDKNSNKMSENPRDINYDKGLYCYNRFNNKDLRIRRILGFYAEQFFSEEDYQLVLRQMAEDSPTSHLILHSSEVLIQKHDGRKDCYVLYTPIERVAPRRKLRQLERVEDSGSPDDYDYA